jgi:hypothetical protein
LLIGETEAIISAYISATQVTAVLQGTLKTQLDIDALKTKKDSDKIEVTHVLHGLANGAAVVIAEAGGLGGIGASNINGSRTISRIIDANKYEITAGASATSEADGGGSPTIESSSPTTEWYEQSYSSYRGFPQAITFHEDRLWFGGTPSQPDGLWASRTGYYYNFDLGKAEDDDAIDMMQALVLLTRYVILCLTVTCKCLHRSQSSMCLLSKMLLLRHQKQKYLCRHQLGLDM